MIGVTLVLHLKPMRCRLSNILRGVRELQLAMGEGPVVVLEVDVDVQAVAAGSARRGRQSATASSLDAVVVAVGPLVEPEDVFRRHRGAAGQGRVLGKHVAGVVAGHEVVVHSP